MVVEADGFDDIIAAIRQDLTIATEALMTASEVGLRDVGQARSGDDGALSRIESGFLRVLEACAFEDMIGQRLSQLKSVSAPRAQLAASGGGEPPLLNGPARPGLGIDQAEADAWLRGEGA